LTTLEAIRAAFPGTFWGCFGRRASSAYQHSSALTGNDCLVFRLDRPRWDVLARKYCLRGLFVHVALVATVLAGGCSQQPGTNLIDQVRNADLSEQKPRPVRQANADANQQPKRQSETFPGDDSFGEQLTSASATSASAPGTPRSGA